ATIKSYRQALQPFLAYCYEQHTKLCHITRQQLSDFLIRRLDVDKISKSSSQYELTVLRQLYKWLIAQQLMTLNPTITIR
ncbi:phage integrase N-terminal SAM-like domain-containing protein, partial [Mycobacterium tuberculosis]|nr:phage integrase N-terminal SAM-like domain-containing protein [Mycobacterium tuberculosis]